MSSITTTTEMIKAGYMDLGTNPNTTPPATDWVRVHVSGSGNYEIWKSDELHCYYSIISD